MKPMTKERREEIESTVFIDVFTERKIHPLALQFIRDLLDAEAFWREAVRTHQEWDTEYLMCDFCDACTYWRPEEKHKPDCPWLLAQD